MKLDDKDMALGRTLLGQVKTKWLISAVIFSLAIYLAVYFSIKSSAAYSSAVGFIKSSDVVHTKFGKVDNITLMPYGFYIKTDGASGKAKLVIYIDGSRMTNTLSIFLEQENGGWVVKHYK